jgi:hypothetical protein
MFFKYSNTLYRKNTSLNPSQDSVFFINQPKINLSKTIQNDYADLFMCVNGLQYTSLTTTQEINTNISVLTMEGVNRLWNNIDSLSIMSEDQTCPPACAAGASLAAILSDVIP